MSLDRLVADLNKAKTAPPVRCRIDPPTIFVSYTPAILLQVDGEPTRANIADTDLGFIVNSNFPLFFQTEATKDYYLYTGAQWLKSASIEGPWTPAPKLPGDFSKVANNPKWADMKQPILSPSAQGKPPTIFYSNKPAEVMLFKGQPAYAEDSSDRVMVRDQHRLRSLPRCSHENRPITLWLVAGSSSRFERSVDLCDSGSTG